MKKPRKIKNKEIIVHVRTESVEDFFNRGKIQAKMLDKGTTLSPKRIISFEDPNDLVKLLTEAKLALLAEVRSKPASISKLSHKLHRSRAAIDKDVQLLESVGIVTSEYVANAGHGRHRIIKAVDSGPIKLHVEAMI